MLLGRFVDTGYLQLDADSRQAFNRLLEQQDTALIEWLVYQQQPAGEFRAIVNTILQSDSPG